MRQQARHKVCEAQPDLLRRGAQQEAAPSIIIMPCIAGCVMGKGVLHLTPGFDACITTL